MQVFESYEQIKKSDVLDSLLKSYMLDDVKKIISSMVEVENYKSYNFSHFCLYAVLESNDNIENLKEIGMTRETITLLESIPEFIDTIVLGNNEYERVVLVLSEDTGRVIYIPRVLVRYRLDIWVKKWKEV